MTAAKTSKSVGWAYKSSVIATEMGAPETGCFFARLKEKGSKNRAYVGPFQTEDDAKNFANGTWPDVDWDGYVASITNKERTS
jgi:hypothetical protein